MPSWDSVLYRMTQFMDFVRPIFEITKIEHI